jgi:hypothetical protein
MLRGRVRIAPACYHVLHLIPVMAAHEMNFFHEEGLRESDGFPAYEIIPGGLVPFGLEKLGLTQAMKEKSIDIALDIMPGTVFSSVPGAPTFTSSRAGATRGAASWSAHLT